jgi:hypothetical protein
MKYDGEKGKIVMTKQHVTELPGDKMRKAIDAFCELKQQLPEKTTRDLLDTVTRKFDLSPLECDFLRRHLDNC